MIVEIKFVDTRWGSLIPKATTNLHAGKQQALADQPGLDAMPVEWTARVLKAQCSGHGKSKELAAAVIN